MWILFLFLLPIQVVLQLWFTDTLHAVIMVLESIILMGFGKLILENWAP